MKTKTRLTITLSWDLLKKVDALVDGHKIRNRSHAIENLVQNSLTQGVNTAIILAGGAREGGEISALKKVGGRYALSHILDHLKKYGIINIVICAGKNQEKIKDIFKDGADFGLNINYVLEKSPLGTAGAIKLAEKYLGESPFLVVNDTTITDLNLEDLITFHLNEETTATICVKPRMSEKKYGQAFMHGNKIVQFLDGATAYGTYGISIVNIGLYIFSRDILDYIPEDKNMSLELEVFPKLATKKELSAFLFQGNWLDVDAQKED